MGTIQVWAIPKRTDISEYKYSYSYGKRPTKVSFIVGEFDRTYNPETGEDEDFAYRGNNKWPQPPYFKVLSMQASINRQKKQSIRQSIYSPDAYPPG